MAFSQNQYGQTPPQGPYGAAPPQPGYAQTTGFGQQTTGFGASALAQAPPIPPQYQGKYKPVFDGKIYSYNGIPLTQGSVADEGLFFKSYIAAIPIVPGQLPQWTPVNVNGTVVTPKAYGGRGRKSKRRQPKMMRQSFRRASISFTGGRRKRTRRTKRYRKK